MDVGWVGWMVGCWVEGVVAAINGLGAGWAAARVTVQEAGRVWMAVALAMLRAARVARR